MTRDHMMGFTQPAENFENWPKIPTYADCYPKDANLDGRIAAEQAEARGNRSQGLCTSGEQRAYVTDLVSRKAWLDGANAFGRAQFLREAIARKAAEPADERIKAAVLGDGWIAWDASAELAPPCVEQLADVRYEEGSEDHVADDAGSLQCLQDDWMWRETGDGATIVAYRLKQPAQPAVVVDEYQHLRDAYSAGKKLQILMDDEWEDWKPMHAPRFNSPQHHYRIKPEGSAN